MVQRVSQSLHSQGQGVEQIGHTLYDIVQDKVDTLEKADFRNLMSSRTQSWAR